MKYTVLELQTKLEQLREKYKNTSGVDRKLIEIRGKLLKKVLDKRGQLV